MDYLQKLKWDISTKEFNTFISLCLASHTTQEFNLRSLLMIIDSIRRFEGFKSILDLFENYPVMIREGDHLDSEVQNSLIFFDQ